MKLMLQGSQPCLGARAGHRPLRETWGCSSRGNPACWQAERGREESDSQQCKSEERFQKHKPDIWH